MSNYKTRQSEHQSTLMNDLKLWSNTKDIPINNERERQRKTFIVSVDLYTKILDVQVYLSMNT